MQPPGQALESAEKEMQQQLDDIKEQLADEQFDHSNTRQVSSAHVQELEAELAALKSGGAPTSSGAGETEFSVMAGKLRSELQTAQVRLSRRMPLCVSVGSLTTMARRCLMCCCGAFRAFHTHTNVSLSSWSIANWKMKLKRFSSRREGRKTASKARMKPQYVS
jgi:hypothetical protein